MRKLIAPLLLGMMASAAGMTPAYANHATVRCGFNTVAQEDLTGGQDTFTGVAYGIIVSPTPGEPVSIRCYVRISGTEVASTTTGSGIQVATTSGQVTYTRTATQNAELCAEWTAGAESGTTCVGTTTIQIPPQEVIDAINDLFDLIADETAALDPILCGVITAAGLPSTINSATAITGIHVDPDDCDIWIITDTIIFVCPVRVIDFADATGTYGDAYNGPATSC